MNLKRRLFADGQFPRRVAQGAAALALFAGAPIALAQSGVEDAADSNDVFVSEFDLVNLTVRDEDLTTVLQMLSMQSQRSIVATQNVSGRVTANLYSVTFGEALDAILLYNGFGYYEEGNTIFVMPIEEIQAREAARMRRVSRVIALNYLNAVDAAQFASPLLSDGGTITTIGATPDFSMGSDLPTGKDNYASEARLVINDFDDNIEVIRELLSSLDTRPAQVLVEATILQSSISEANAFGIDFSILGGLDFVDFTDIGGPLRVVDGLITGGAGAGNGDGEPGTGGSAIPDDGRGVAIGSTVGNTLGNAGFKVGVVNDSFAVFMRLLDEVGDTTIISNPKVLTLNRQPASVQVGRRVGYLSTTTTDTATSQTVEFLDTGTQLYFRPFVTNEGFIRMELRPKVSQPIIRTVSDTAGRTLTIPDEDTSQLVTNVLVRDGQTIVLGGLFTERTASTRRQVPFVGDLPLVGAAFRGHSDSTDRAEIIFMITPTILNDQILLEQGERAKELVHNSRAGAREGLLPWSRERQSSQLLIEAERLASQGRTEQALNRVQRSLSLHPNQPEAIGLRTRLMNEQTHWPTRSLLNEIINEEASHRATTYGFSDEADDFEVASDEQTEKVAGGVAKTSTAKAESIDPPLTPLTDEGDDTYPVPPSQRFGPADFSWVGDELRVPPSREFVVSTEDDAPSTDGRVAPTETVDAGEPSRELPENFREMAREASERYERERAEERRAQPRRTSTTRSNEDFIDQYLTMTGRGAQPTEAQTPSSDSPTQIADADTAAEESFDRDASSIDADTFTFFNIFDRELANSFRRAALRAYREMRDTGTEVTGVPESDGND
ncbi:MAG: hypothetical protein JJU33_05800 [Phycisphaerales bacterium]|nr:hypothetical protein [Phycisphaerales bacterium]